MNRKQAYWTCQIAGWSLVSGISLLLVNWKAQEGWDVLLNQVLSVGLGVGLTHAFRAYAQRAGWLDLSPSTLKATLSTRAALITRGASRFRDRSSHPARWA